MNYFFYLFFAALLFWFSVKAPVVTITFLTMALLLQSASMHSTMITVVHLAGIEMAQQGVGGRCSMDTAVSQCYAFHVFSKMIIPVPMFSFIPQENDCNQK